MSHRWGNEVKELSISWLKPLESRVVGAQLRLWDVDSSLHSKLLTGRKCPVVFRKGQWKFPHDLRWNEAENLVDLWLTPYHLTRHHFSSKSADSSARERPGPLRTFLVQSKQRWLGSVWVILALFSAIKRTFKKINVEIFFHHPESMHFAHLKNTTTLPVSGWNLYVLPRITLNQYFFQHEALVIL